MARILMAVLGAFLLVAVLPAPGLGPDQAVAQQVKKKKKGLKGSIGYRRAYSYSKQDVVGSDNRRFYDPSRTRQTPGGPFDNGFFFDTPLYRGGGESPYMQ
jgi:hypothetical protein